MALVKKITSISAPDDGNYAAIVTCVFTAVQISGGSGSDWGSGYKARCFVTQNSSTSYGDDKKLSTSKNSYAVTYTFALSAGYTIEAGLDISLSGPANMDCTDIKIQCVIVKR